MTWHHDRRHAVGYPLAATLLCLLGACGAGGGSAAAGPGGSGGGGRGPGAVGNPLDVPLGFQVQNQSQLVRTETIRASIPFPEHGYPNTDSLVVSGQQTAWTVLQRWADGTVKIAQAQFTDTLQPGQLKHYDIARDTPALQEPFEHNSWVAFHAGQLQIGAEVRDTFDVPYRAVCEGGGETLESTSEVLVTRFRTYHFATGAPGINRDYLTSTFYVTEFRDVPVVLVDWVLGNDYLGADQVPAGNQDPNLLPLGMIDVKDARFLARGVTEVMPYRAVTEAIAGPVAQGDGFTACPVMQNTYLEDGQTRRYRFLLRFEHPNVAQEDRDRWLATAQAMQAFPLYPIADLATWQQTAAAGLLGGPIDPPVDGAARAAYDVGFWTNLPHFGTWGSRGDPLKTGTTGTPRNGPLTAEFMHAMQTGNPGLLQVLEQKAWAQAMRPYHLYGLRVGPGTDILLWDGVPIYPGSRDLSHESLGRRALWANDPYSAYRTMVQTGDSRAHGWEHFDEEHWSTDLLFDHWTVSGDAWAKEELRQLGETLKGLMVLSNYATANVQAVRAEGWTMQSFAQCYLATGDESLREHALARVHQVVDVQRHTEHASRAMAFQANYTGTGFPMPHQFFMPWQHGAALYGYLGAYRFFGDAQLFRICEDVIPMLDYSWVHNLQTLTQGFVVEGLRYYVPVEYNGQPIPANYWDNDPAVGIRLGDTPTGGPASFLIGGLLLLADWSDDPQVRQQALHYGEILRGTVTEADRWDKWRALVPAGHVQ